MVNLSNIRVAFGDRVIINRGDFLLRPRDRVGLVGPNGAGKTTLLKVISGIEKPDEGTVAMDPGTVVGYFSQEVGEMSGRSALEEVLAGAGRVFEAGREMAVLEHRMSEPGGSELSAAEMDRYGALQMEFQRHGGYDLENRAEAIRAALTELVKRERDREIDERIVAAYTAMPQTDDEVEWAGSRGFPGLPDEDWDEWL